MPNFHQFLDSSPGLSMSTAYVGKRDCESEDEKQVSAKKQKRDEVAEEQKNNMEIVLDDSFSDSEPVMVFI